MTGIPADGGGKRLSDLHPRDRHAFLEAGIAGALGDGFWQGDNLVVGRDGDAASGVAGDRRAARRQRTPGVPGHRGARRVGAARAAGAAARSASTGCGR